MTMHSALYRLSKIDRKLTILSVENQELLKKRKSEEAAVNADRAGIAQIETDYNNTRGQIAHLEAMMKDQEAAIIERRKQITGLGGAKSAKFAERELDLTTRNVKDLEDRVLGFMQRAEELKGALERHKELLATKQDAFESAEALRGERMAKIKSEQQTLEQQRAVAVAEVEATALRTYDRVRTKHPAEAVGLIDGGACKSCLRAIAPQQVNIIIAGATVVLCPGCSRILVMAESATDDIQ